MSNKYKVRDKRNRGWFYMDNEYLNGLGKHLGVTGIAIYVSLCRHADNEQKCFPAQETIAEELGCSVATIKRYLRLLTKHNVIAIERVKKGRKWAHNVYYLLDKSEWIYPKKVSRVTETPDNQEVHSSMSNGSQLNEYLSHSSHRATKDTNKKKTNELDPYSEVVLLDEETEYIYSDDFMAFWNMYPVKKAKKKAALKWEKINERTKTIIKQDVPKRNQEDDNWIRGYAPHATTYLNGERWNDEITKPKNSTPMGYIG